MLAEDLEEHDRDGGREVERADGARRHRDPHQTLPKTHPYALGKTGAFPPEDERDPRWKRHVPQVALGFRTEKTRLSPISPRRGSSTSQDGQTTGLTCSQ